jgi:hypothetical protein
MRLMLNVLHKCFTKLVAVLPDEMLDRLHHAIEVERYRRVLSQRQPIAPHQARRWCRRGHI